MALLTWLPVPLPTISLETGNATGSPVLRVGRALQSHRFPGPGGVSLGCILLRGPRRFLPQPATCLDHLVPRCLVPEEKLRPELFCGNSLRGSCQPGGGWDPRPRP